MDVLYEWSLAPTSEEPPIHDAERRPRLFSSADESSARRLGREGFLRVSDFEKELARERTFGGSFGVPLIAL